MSRSVSGVLPLDEAKRPTTILAPPLSLEPLPGTPIRPPPPLQQVAGLREAAILCHLLLLALCLSVCVWDHKQKIQAGRQAGREEEQGAYGFLGCRVHCCCTHTHTGPTNSIRETHDDYTTRTAGKWWLARHSTLVLHHHFRFDVCFPSFFLLFLATTSWPNEEEEASNPF